MADFNRAFDIIKHLEYGDCSNALHWNKNEEGWTFMGIYQKYHPKSIIWDKLKEYQKQYKTTRELSRKLCNDQEVLNEVKNIYRVNYWNRAKLYAINSQKIAEEIFVFGVNAGIKRAIKKAQKIVGVTPDGIVGNKTITALNNYDEDLFDVEFDVEEVKYYKNLIKSNPRFAIFKNGWINRAKKV